jgi:hypothetical protein
VSLPDGRFWAHLDRELLDGLVTGTTEPGGLERHQRGNPAVDQRAQIVERALLSRFGWRWTAAELTSVDVADGGVGGAGGADRFEVELRWEAAPPLGAGLATALVSIGRQLPVPVCGENPETAGDTHPEYVLDRLRVVGGPQ